MKDADAIRSHVVARYVEPARQRGDQTFAVVAGDVHRALQLEDRVPNVCSAVRTKKFLEANELELVNVAGPSSKKSTTTTFTYRFLPRPVSYEQKRNAVWELLGAGSETLEALGGGEHWLREERASFLETDFAGSVTARPGRQE